MDLICSIFFPSNDCDNTSLKMLYLLRNVLINLESHRDWSRINHCHNHFMKKLRTYYSNFMGTSVFLQDPAITTCISTQERLFFYILKKIHFQKSAETAYSHWDSGRAIKWFTKYILFTQSYFFFKAKDDELLWMKANKILQQQFVSTNLMNLWLVQFVLILPICFHGFPFFYQHCLAPSRYYE